MAIFTWNVGDPLYYLSMNRAIPDGFDREDVYELSAYGLEKNFLYISDSVRDARWEQFDLFVRNHPQILTPVNSKEGHFGTLSRKYSQLITDTMAGDTTRYTVEAQVLEYNTADGVDVLGLYGFEVLSFKGEGLSNTSHLNCEIWLSHTLAVELYGSTDVEGKRIVRPVEGTVAGVLRDVKLYPFSQPARVAVICHNDRPQAAVDNHFIGPDYLLRLRPDTDVERFKAEVDRVGHEIGYSYVECQSLGELSRSKMIDTGERNTFKMMRALAGFALACVLLGMLGTFWVRCAASRGDIAVMRALGATRWRVVRHFLSEAALLVTAACLVAAPVIAAQVKMFGVYGITEGQSPLYPQNVLWSHCLHLALLCYAFLLIVALVGAAIPVVKAVQEPPVEGLKEE